MKPRRILVVDDKAYFVHILDCALRMEGYDVVTAMTGDEAMRQVGRNHISLVVCGQSGPAGIDGLELCQRVRDRRPAKKLPLLLLTSAGLPYDHEKADRLNLTVIEKLSIHRLMESVHDALEKKPAPQ